MASQGPGIVSGMVTAMKGHTHAHGQSPCSPRVAAHHAAGPGGFALPFTMNTQQLCCPYETSTLTQHTTQDIGNACQEVPIHTSGRLLPGRRSLYNSETQPQGTVHTADVQTQYHDFGQETCRNLCCWQQQIIPWSTACLHGCAVPLLVADMHPGTVLHRESAADADVLWHTLHAAS